MRKSFSTRIKITKKGKIVRRPMAIDHHRLQKSKKLNRKKRKGMSLVLPFKDILQNAQS